MGLAGMRAETETMQEDIRGFSLASLAQITAWRSLFEGGICNARRGRICSRWPSLHLFHTSESLWSPKTLHKEEAVSAKRTGVSRAERHRRSSPHILKMADWASWWWTSRAKSFGVKKKKKKVLFRIKRFWSHGASKCPSAIKKKHMTIKSGWVFHAKIKPAN